MYSLRFTVVLVLFLFIPLILRLLDFEPYPAVLFPAGAGQVHINKEKEIQLDAKVVFGLRQNGKWDEIDAGAFLNPASKQYMLPIILNNLGFRDNNIKPKGSKTSVFLKKALRIQRPYQSPEEVAELRNWLDTRLAKQGFVPGQLKIISYTKTISTTRALVLNKKINDEKLISYDK